MAKAGADELGLPLYRYVGGANAHVLPVPMMNVLNGGVHADNTVDFQEFMIMPVGAASYSEGLRWGVETYHALKSCCTSGACRPSSATKAASLPTSPRTRTRCSLLVEAIERAGYALGDRDRDRARPGDVRALPRRLATS